MPNGEGVAVAAGVRFDMLTAMVVALWPMILIRSAGMEKVAAVFAALRAPAAERKLLLPVSSVISIIGMEPMRPLTVPPGMLTVKSKLPLTEDKISGAGSDAWDSARSGPFPTAARGEENVRTSPGPTPATRPLGGWLGKADINSSVTTWSKGKANGGMVTLLPSESVALPPAEATTVWEVLASTPAIVSEEVEVLAGSAMLLPWTMTVKGLGSFAGAA